MHSKNPVNRTSRRKDQRNSAQRDGCQCGQSCQRGDVYNKNLYSATRPTMETYAPEVFTLRHVSTRKRVQRIFSNYDLCQHGHLCSKTFAHCNTSRRGHVFKHFTVPQVSVGARVRENISTARHMSPWTHVQQTFCTVCQL